ncbi:MULTISPECIES: SDR family NAD(P)-dependent oxidoreductase [Pseudescherichia]|uniref:SDR family NAD(P)-dependent oxidoreductase n=1 Tax=Pseudescherichia TaxID=2055880 RepID=UPI0028B170FC|nr:glucose 1-dehydrogenase [Pseudescherichia sp.]
MNIRFDGKAALVTGAASGIGLSTAVAFAQSGASVVLADLDFKAAESEAQKLVDAGYKAIAVRCDVTSESDAANAVEICVATFGSLDVAFNNAGLHVPVENTADAHAADFDLAIAVNLRGVWNCLKHELKQMRKQGSGAVVNCSSNSGLAGIANLGAYTASKHGVIGLTKSAALEYAPMGINVNAVCPGPVETPMVQRALSAAPEHMNEVIKEIPAGRLGRSDEIASAVLWLCSEQARFVVGQAIAVDGGFTTK